MMMGLAIADRYNQLRRSRQLALEENLRATRQGLDLNIVATANGVAITKAMVIAGIGSTVLTRSAVVDEVEAGKLVSSRLVPELTWGLCLLMRLDRAGNRNFQEIARITEEVTADLHGRGIL